MTSLTNLLIKIKNYFVTSKSLKDKFVEALEAEIEATPNEVKETIKKSVKKTTKK